MDQTVTFLDLLTLEPALPATDAQSRARIELPTLVRRSALLWFPDLAGANGKAERFVIGVAVWSNYDLRLLDLLNEVSARSDAPAVAVFDLDALASPDELERTFPGIGPVFQTPVVGHWRDGNLVETASGFAARQLLGSALGFDPQLVIQPPAQVA